MCYAHPAKCLDLARARLTPEQWAKFEADFEHFCAYSGFPMPMGSGLMWSGLTLSPMRSISTAEELDRYNWAKWAYLCGKGL